MAKHMKKNHQSAIERRENRTRQKEKLTNWYMINLCWGLVGLLLLTVLYYCYKDINTLTHMPLVTWILTGVFAVAAIVIFVLGKNGVIKNSIRAKHYSAFLGICTLASLWLALYNKIRVILQAAVNALTGGRIASIGSYWNVWLLMIAIGIYLVITFIYYIIKEHKI